MSDPGPQVENIDADGSWGVGVGEQKGSSEDIGSKESGDGCYLGIFQPWLEVPTRCHCGSLWIQEGMFTSLSQAEG